MGMGRRDLSNVSRFPSNSLAKENMGGGRPLSKASNDPLNGFDREAFLSGVPPEMQGMARKAMAGLVEEVQGHGDPETMVTMLRERLEGVVSELKKVEQQKGTTR